MLLWGMESDTDRERYSLGSLTARIPNDAAKEIVQFIIFLCIGTYVALLLSEPEKAKQAFAAGLGWTAGVNSAAKRVRRSSNKKKEKEAQKAPMVKGNDSSTL